MMKHAISIHLTQDNSHTSLGEGVVHSIVGDVEVVEWTANDEKKSSLTQEDSTTRMKGVLLTSLVLNVVKTS